MTESTIFDPEHSQQPQPGMNNKPTASRGALAFNPLHPSMELPPEQLIRLLGMESKKTRKHLKMQRSSNQQKPHRAINEQKTPPSSKTQDSRHITDEQKPQASPDPQKSQRIANEQKTHRPPSQGAQKKTTDRQQRAQPQQVARPNHSMEYERNQPAIIDKRGSGLSWLLPALVTGLVAGVTVSAALFWYQSSPTAKQKAPAPLVSSEPQNRRIPKQQQNRQPLKRKAAPGSTKTVKLPTPAPAKAVRGGNDANRQAALKAEQNRLRRAAEQRLTEQLTKMKVNRELADLQAPAAVEHTPAAAATLSAAAEPAFDQAVVNEPAAVAGAESPPSEEAPVEMIQADETKPLADLEILPAETPSQAVGSDSHGGILEESTGFVDSFEQDTAADVAAPVEQDIESNIAPSLDVTTPTAFTRSTEQDTVPDVTSLSGDELDTEQSTSTTSDENSLPVSEDSASF